MSAIMIDEGLVDLLKKMSGNVGGNSPDSLRLFTAVAGGLSKTSVLANFTQATGMGYAAITIGGTDWSYALNGTTHRETATLNKSWTFTAGAGMTILGWYMLNATGGRVMIAEQFAAGIVIPAGGGSLALTVNWDFGDCT